MDMAAPSMAPGTADTLERVTLAKVTRRLLPFLFLLYIQSPVPVVLALSPAAAGSLSSHGPFWPLPSTFLSGSAAAGGIALIVSVGNLAGFIGPYMKGLLKGASGNFQRGLRLLALAALAGSALALWLRRAPLLSTAHRIEPAPVAP